MDEKIDYKINKLSLKIENLEVEKLYQSHSIEQSINQFRFAMVTGVFFFLLFILVDHYTFTTVTRTFIAIRIYIIIPFFLVSIIITYLPIYKKHAHEINIIIVMVSGLILIGMSYVGRNEPEISRFYNGLIIIFFYLFAFFKLSYYKAFILGTTLILLYLLVDVVYINTSNAILLLTSLMMLACDMIGGSIAYIMEHHSKKEYLLKKMLSESAISDALTGLYNRHYFDQYCVNDINAFIVRSKNMSQIERRHNDIKAAKYGMLMIDIDFFKRINDTFGHHSGDLVLQQFASILKSNVRRLDDVLRVGGEEFLLIIKLTTEVYLMEFVKKLGKIIEAYDFRVDGGVIGCSVSMGIVVIPTDHNDDVHGLLKLADRALYKSKDAGRNRGHRCYQLQGAVEFEEVIWTE